MNPQHLKLLSDWSDLYRHLIALAFTQHGSAQRGLAADDLNELSAADQLHAAPFRAKKQLLLLFVGIDQADQRAELYTGYALRAFPRAHQSSTKEENETAKALNLSPADQLKVGSRPWLNIQSARWLNIRSAPTAGLTWERWFAGESVFRLSNQVGPAVGGLIAYVIATFVFYWWHRLRHEVQWLWVGFHQIHHSPQRLEVITSFYKHPGEMVAVHRMRPA